MLTYQHRLVRIRAQGKTIYRLLHLDKTGGGLIHAVSGIQSGGDGHVLSFLCHTQTLDEAAFIYRDIAGI